MSENDILDGQGLYNEYCLKKVIVVAHDKSMSVTTKNDGSLAIVYCIVFVDVNDKGYQFMCMDSPTLYVSVIKNRKYEIDVVTFNKAGDVQIVGIRNTTRRLMDGITEIDTAN